MTQNRIILQKFGPNSKNGVNVITSFWEKVLIGLIQPFTVEFILINPNFGFVLIAKGLYKYRGGVYKDGPEMGVARPPISVLP